MATLPFPALARANLQGSTAAVPPVRAPFALAAAQRANPAACSPTPPRRNACCRSRLRKRPVSLRRGLRCRASPAQGSTQDELVSLRVAGLSVSETGFMALLSFAEQNPDRATDRRILPLQITSGGADRERAESIEALTLLQLVQGIDVGVRLPIDALSQACPGVPEGSLLRRVVLRSVPSGAGELLAELHVSAASYECDAAFEALGLALRYHAPLSMPKTLWAASSLCAADAAAAFPQALPVEESAAQAQSISSNISLAWRVGTDPIGTNDIVNFRRQLGQAEPSAPGESEQGL
eukprot:jgi/Tetstr1/434622/TSEL_023713.t1